MHTAEAPDATEAAETTERPGLLSSVGSLGAAGLDLAHNTVELAACEARVIVRRLAVRAGVFFASLVFAILGLQLVLGGIAVLLSTAGVALWLALLLVGLVAVGAGAFFAMRFAKRLGDRDLAFERTLEELRKDVQHTLRGRVPPEGSRIP